MLNRERPPSYHSHDNHSISLPSVPTTDFQTLPNHMLQGDNVLSLPPIQQDHDGSRTLPPMQSPPLEQLQPTTEHNSIPTSWPSSNPLTAYYQSSTDSPVPMDLDLDRERHRRGGSVLSIDAGDPDVRIAAEALGDLRAGAYFPSLHLVFASRH